MRMTDEELAEWERSFDEASEEVMKDFALILLSLPD